MQEDRHYGPETDCHTATPQYLWPADAFTLMQLLRSLEMADNPADLTSAAAHHHYDLTNLTLDLDVPGAIQIFSSFLDRFPPRTLSWIRTITIHCKAFLAVLRITSAGIPANPQGEWTVVCPCSLTPRQVKFEMGEWSYAPLGKRQVFCRSFHEGVVRELTRLARGNNGFDVAAYKSIANGLGKIWFNLSQMPTPFEFTTKCQVCTWHMQQGEKPAGDPDADSSGHVLASEYGRPPPAKNPIGKRHLSQTWALELLPAAYTPSPFPSSQMTPTSSFPGSSSGSHSSSNEWPTSLSHQHHHQQHPATIIDSGYVSESFYHDNDAVGGMAPEWSDATGYDGHQHGFAADDAQMQMHAAAIFHHHHQQQQQQQSSFDGSGGGDRWQQQQGMY